MHLHICQEAVQLLKKSDGKNQSVNKWKVQNDAQHTNAQQFSTSIRHLEIREVDSASPLGVVHPGGKHKSMAEYAAWKYARVLNWKHARSRSRSRLQ